MIRAHGVSDALLPACNVGCWPLSQMSPRACGIGVVQCNGNRLSSYSFGNYSIKSIIYVAYAL